MRYRADKELKGLIKMVQQMAGTAIPDCQYNRQCSVGEIGKFPFTFN